MGGPLDAVKAFIDLEKENPMQPIVNAQQAYASMSGAEVEPTGHPVIANGDKTELQRSAPAVIPSQVAVASIQGSGIGSIADVEAGASLDQLSPQTTRASVGSSSILGSEALQKAFSNTSGSIGMVADVESGTALLEVVPKQEAKPTD